MKKRVAPLLLLILVLQLVPPRALGLNVYLDGFRINATGSVSIAGSGVLAVAVQPWDGKIVIGGDFSASAGAVTRQFLARLNPDGTLDASFNPAPDGPVRAILVQPALKRLIVGGSFGSAGGSPRHSLARLDPGDGSADGFNPVSTAAPVTVESLALSADGLGVFVGGSFGELAAGAPCPPNLAGIAAPAAGAGAVTWSYAGTALNGPVHTVLVQGGSVTAGGSFLQPLPYLVRFQAAGTPDGGFTPPAPGGAVRSLALQVDGKLVVGGDFSGGALGRDFLARLAPDGTRDDTFDPRPSAPVSTVVLQPDGKILLGGSFGALGAGLVRNRMARVNLSGTPDARFNPSFDAGVRAIAVQPDGKILAGGEFGNAAGKPRTRLARLYAEQGALDDDLPPLAIVNSTPEVLSLAMHPDGDITLVGAFTSILGQARTRIARLRQDFSLVGAPDINPRLQLGPTPVHIAPLPDKSVIVGGSFAYTNYSAAATTQRLVARIDPQGRDTPFNTNMIPQTQIGVESGFLRGLKAVIAVPPERQPDGSLLDGMLYLGGLFIPNTSPLRAFRNLTKVDINGIRDPAFLPPDPAVTGMVLSLVHNKDGTVWVGTITGKLLKLNPSGGIDLDLTPALGGLLNRGIYAIVPQHDGRLILTGETTEPGKYNEGDWQRAMIRISPDGTVDPDFLIQARYLYTLFDIQIYDALLQTDGSMIIYGIFDTLMDAKGNVYPRDKVARITASGEVDPDFDVGTFSQYTFSPLDNLVTAHLQTDGKVFLGGNFPGLNGDPGKRVFIRFGNGFASQDLSLSPDGRTITWLRSGTGPDLWWAGFETCDDLESATPDCRFLGRAYPIPGGWQLGVPDLPSYGTGNRFLRARGNMAGATGSGGSLVESVRLYHLLSGKIPVNVTADPEQGKQYGDSDPPLSYSFSPALNGSDSFSGELRRATGENVGKYPIGQGTLALGDGYQLNFTGSDFTISPAPLTVRAENKSRDLGAPNPELTVLYDRAGIDAAALGGAPFLATGAGPDSPPGDYTISVYQGSISSGNYSYSFLDGILTVRKACQAILFPELGEKTYGDPPFPAGASACSGLPVSYASSDTKVARVEGGTLVITGAGTVTITAAQAGDGSQDPAATVSRTLVVKKAAQSLNFPAPADRLLGDPPFDPGALASSLLPVSYLSSNPEVAEAVGNLVRLRGTGTTVLTALQAGGADFEPALPVSRPLRVALEADPPRLSVSTLSPGAVSAAPVLNVTGSASDSSGIASLTVNGRDLTAQAALFSEAVELKGGENLIEVVALDGAGNRASRTTSVRFDAASPAISLAEPADGGVTDAADFELKGTAPPGSSVSLSLNGAAPAPLTVEGGNFRGSGTLVPGLNTLEVEALLDGRASRVKRSVRLAPGAPAVALTDPPQDLRTESPSVTLSGAVGPGAVRVALDLDGSAVVPALRGGVFQANLLLAEPGVHRVTATATDATGGSSVAYRNLVRVPLILGDLDGDGLVDIRDAAALLRIALGMDPATSQALAHGDLAPLVQGAPRADGRIDAGDVLLLLRKIVGLQDF